MTHSRFYILFLASTSLVATAADQNKSIELKLVMAVDSQQTKIPFNDELLSVPSLVERYRQNEVHPFGKVTAYALQTDAVVKVGKIGQLHPDSLHGLSSKKALFVSYVLHQEEKLTHALLTGTSAVRNVNLLKKYLEGRQTTQETKPTSSPFTQDKADAATELLEQLLKATFPELKGNNPPKQ